MPRISFEQCARLLEWRDASGNDYLRRCTRMTCPGCGPVMIKDTRAAVAMMEPNWSGFFTDVGDDSRLAWDRVSRVWSALRNGTPWFEAASVMEQYPEREGFHIHFVMRSEREVDADELTALARRWGMGLVMVEPIRWVTSITEYLFKSAIGWSGDETVPRADVAGMIGRLERFKDLNGPNRFVRTTRGYFQYEGNRISVAEARRRGRLWRGMSAAFSSADPIDHELESLFI